MSTQPIRVLVVDDSVLIREMIKDRIAETPGMDVVGTAGNGELSLPALDRFHPDVVTLDIQMPKMDGLEALAAILDRQPVPVIMVSALTQRGADTTLDALDRGAMDYVAKPEVGSPDARQWLDELVRKIQSVAGADVAHVLKIRKERKLRRQQRRQEEPQGKQVSQAVPAELENKCIAIAISTGGPPALASVFETLRTPMPPVVVVQHMPAQFTKSFAWRLDSLSSLSVKEARDGDLLRPNHVLIAPGGKHLQLRRHQNGVKARIVDGPPVSSHKPSADVMMRSAAEAFGPDCLGIIMTGMGRDGSDGCRDIRQAGGYVLGQDQASSDVYGMNRVAQIEGNVDRQFSLSKASGTIAVQIKRLWKASCAAAP